MEASQATKQPQKPRVEYLIVDEGESAALDEVFDMLFDLVGKKLSEK
jgi:hypothetical protein